MMNISVINSAYPGSDTSCTAYTIHMSLCNFLVVVLYNIDHSDKAISFYNATGCVALRQ